MPIDRSALIAAGSLIWEGGLRRDIVSLAAKPNLPWMTTMMMAMKKSDKLGLAQMDKTETQNPQFETNSNDQSHKNQTTWFPIPSFGL
jgi:hypothetical protein